MQARRLPAVRGWYWIVEGFRLFRNNPAQLTFLVFGYWLTLIFLNLVPLIGFIVAPLCAPALSVSIMNGCRAVERKEAFQFGMLFSGFQRNPRQLAFLGALYMAGSIAVLAASAAVDGGALFEIMLVSGQASPTALEDENLLLALQMVLVMMIPLLMAFWFAPLLAAWDDKAALKSLFFSFVACWRNWRAFAVYGLGVAFISVILPGVALGLVTGLSGPFLKTLAVAVTLPILFVFMPTLFASFYVSYRDVFVSGEQEALGN